MFREGLRLRTERMAVVVREQEMAASKQTILWWKTQRKQPIWYCDESKRIWSAAR